RRKICGARPAAEIPGDRVRHRRPFLLAHGRWIAAGRLSRRREDLARCDHERLLRRQRAMILRHVSQLLCAAAFAAALALAPAHDARAESTVTIGVVNDFAGWNPYADSTAQMYMIWCQTYGCLGTFDTNKGEYVPMLAQSWETDKNDPRIWYFHLRQGLKRHHDGKELTADDVVHSIDRTRRDPHTAQLNNVHPIASAVAADRYTVKITTTEPTAPLLDYIFDRLIITGKDLFDKYGASADRKAPYGWGPYAVGDVAIGQRMVLNKNPDWPAVQPQNPHHVVFTRIREDEPRITALLNGEVQIALAI